MNQGQMRRIPSMHRILTALEGWPPQAARYMAQREIEAARAAVREGEQAPSFEDLIGRIRARLKGLSPGLRPVVNATGVVIHTNLGRAPLSPLAREAVESALAYSDLELDLETGQRSSRLRHVADLLKIHTGAEAALSVNNNAAGVFLALRALCQGREVIVSRGEQVEIGGGFRIPDVLRESGARLVEVGTTNRTRLSDYAGAVTLETAAVLKVHPSNFHQIGFTESTSIEELSSLCRERGLLLLDDLGSGAFTDPATFGLRHEPTVAEHVAGGADLVFFSGDKLLGGPQAGLVVGKEAPVRALSAHPLYRALRLGKASMAALRATLYEALTDPGAVPVTAMLSATEAELTDRAEKLAKALEDLPDTVSVRVGPIAGVAGGGALPGEALAGVGLFLTPLAMSEGDAAAALRRGEPALLVRTYDGTICVDPRTFLPGDLALAARALRRVFGGKGGGA